MSSEKVAALVIKPAVQLTQQASGSASYRVKELFIDVLWIGDQPVIQGSEGIAGIVRNNEGLESIMVGMEGCCQVSRMILNASATLVA